MTTTTTVPDRKAQRAADRAKAERLAEIAAKLLAGHSFKPDRRPVVAKAFGRALAGTSPNEAHGQLLAACLRPAARFTDRPDAERAVFRLARLGETPTQAAISAYLADDRRRREYRQQLEVAIAARVEVDGPRAAGHVAEIVRDTGDGPSWFELCVALGWPGKPQAFREGVIRQLARDGWLQFSEEPRSLRPGPAALDGQEQP